MLGTHAAPGVVLDMFTIYENPSDFPGKFVVRKHAVGHGGVQLVAGSPEAVVDTLEEARAVIPGGRVSVGREAGDDPVIVETWV